MKVLLVRLLTKIYATIFIALIFFASASFVSAASISLRPENQTLKLNQVFTVAVDVDPEEDNFKSVAAELAFDPTVVVITQVNTDASFFTTWSEKPEYSNAEGRLNFSGEADNVLRTKSTVLEISFRTIGIGDAGIKVSDATAILSDDTKESINIFSDVGYTVLPLQPVVIEAVNLHQKPMWSAEVIPAGAILLNLILLAVLLAFVVYIFYVKHSYKEHERRLREETAEIHEQMGKIFSALRDEIYDQIRSITNRKKLTKREEEAVAGLNQAVELSKTLIEKEVNDVKELLD